MPRRYYWRDHHTATGSPEYPDRPDRYPDDHGEDLGDDVPTYAWPGGYDLAYPSSIGLEYCGECARRLIVQSLRGRPFPGFPYTISWEASPYGEPETIGAPIILDEGRDTANTCDDCGEYLQPNAEELAQ